jgi:hypothetical protein
MSMAYSRKASKNKKLVRAAWILAVLVLVITGVGYQLVASKMNVFLTASVKLAVPLSEFPFIIGRWTGEDVPISETVLRIAANDDYLSRLYVDNVTNQPAKVYVAYSARPRTMLGHRPQVCYPANGWIHDRTEKARLVSRSGREISCLMHNFHKRESGSDVTDGIIVLNFYIVNGMITDDESVFYGIGWRTPNIAGDPAFYVTQVQISSNSENTVRSLAMDLTDLILAYFPDESGGGQSG